MLVHFHGVPLLDWHLKLQVVRQSAGFLSQLGVEVCQNGISDPLQDGTLCWSSDPRRAGVKGRLGKLEKRLSRLMLPGALGDRLG